MQVGAHFTRINAMVATVKAAIMKNKDQFKDFNEASLPLPLELALKRWITWLNAAFYYSEHLPVVCAIVNNWEDDGLLVKQTKEAVNNGHIVADMVKICQCWSFADNVQQLEAADYTIGKAYLD